MKPSIKTLHKYLVVNKRTGRLTWRRRTPSMFKGPLQYRTSICASWNKRNAGKAAGNLDNNGYLRINIRGKKLLAHIIVWAMAHNRWPTRRLDHKDTNRTNNRISNLRLADRYLNGANRSIGTNNTSGFKGVSASRGAWVARIQVKKVGLYLGRFPTPERAHRAYVRAATQYFGEFARAA